MSTGRSSESQIDITARRVGYLVGAVVNIVLLWVSHQLLDWGWPGFLTQEFDDLLPLITLSFTVSIVGYLVLFVTGAAGKLKQLFDAITAGIGALVLIRFLQVDPFDFSGYEFDWSLVVRFVLVVALIGSILGFIVSTVKLLRPTDDDRGERTATESRGLDRGDEPTARDDSFSPPAV